MQRPFIIGHRGAAGQKENTVPGFEHALAQGADGFELDVRRSGDGQLVAMHSPVAGRHSVGSAPYEEFRDLGEGYSIPLFEDVLKRFAHRAFLDVELKEPGFEEQALDLIQTHGDVGRTMISGFHTEMLNKVHDLLPEIQTGFIFNRTQDEEIRHNSPIDFVIPQFRLASRNFIEEVHDEDLKVLAWTVNSEAEMRRLLDLGVDGMITDEPGLLASVLGR
ncbi:MAG: glycerophosphodiester phosphodiesterase [Bryobacterales bacterium]|nr:glycerophosphodiester phosphodiesterase [Bryobacterales bacterium]